MLKSWTANGSVAHHRRDVKLWHGVMPLLRRLLQIRKCQNMPGFLPRPNVCDNTPSTYHMALAY
jgi:hypothetical protein